MSVGSRNSELFVGENWQVIYEAYSQINFAASDPASISQAMQSYIQTNYPEQFNDWIISSEFVMILDLLAWLAGNLAFKTDLSVRENFMETAQAKASVLRLARFLSYNPSRNVCAQGVLKLTAISTNDAVYDSNGVNLANTTITWNNPDDTMWYERFITVLNEAFVSTNPFGIPIQNGSIGGVTTQTYRFNSMASKNNYGFNSIVSGTSMNFEVCNGDFTNGETLFERTPNPSNAFQFYYLNDGNGNGSSQTGFFSLFKQGSTQSTTFNIPQPIQNTLLNVNTQGINQNDVWVQTVDDSNNVLITWTPVPIMLNENITYNTLSADQRNIYSVLTKDSDTISVRFSDGNFGNAPTGNILVTYRVSNGLLYTINPSDISNVQMSITYVNGNGVNKILTMTYSLQQAVTNSGAAETVSSIQQNSPLVYATQNRMVSGQDYNTFPLQTNLAVKLKSLNRVYSGQSRYIDLNDPTGFYQDLSIFADDGIIFSEDADGYAEIPTGLNLTITDIIDEYIQPMLSSQAAINAVNNIYMQNIIAGNSNLAPPTGMTWTQSTSSVYTTTGWFNISSDLITQGSMIQFIYNGITMWVGVDTINPPMTTVPLANTAGPVTLSAVVPTGAVVQAILPTYVYTLSNETITTITNNLSANLSFSLVYDFLNGWIINPALTGIGANVLNGTQIVMMEVDYLTVMWRIGSRGLNYVFESITTVEWFNNGTSAIDEATGQSSMDSITVMKVNPDLNNPLGFGFTKPYEFSIGNIWTYSNGLPEPRRTLINFADTTNSGYADNPDAYYKIIPPMIYTWEPNTYYISGVNVISGGVVYQCAITHTSGSTFTFSADWIIPASNITTKTNNNSYLFWQMDSQNLLEPYYGMLVFTTETLLKSAINSYAPAIGTEAFVIAGGTQYRNNSFWTYSQSGWTQDTSQTYAFENGRGPNVAYVWISDSSQLSTVNTLNSFIPEPVGDQLAFHWKHYATYSDRIDPASQSIQDMYVLTSSYDSAIRLWIQNGSNPSDEPSPPTELDLRLAFQSMEDYKMFSDTMIWHPVSYKLLFGSAADSDLQMQFKVVPSSSTTMSDGEIQATIISAINAYFSVQYWDFGDTFYWSELSAYIHLQMAGAISSIVIVPMNANSAFGDGFEIPCDPDEIFISCANVSNIVIISSNTPTNLRIR